MITEPFGRNPLALALAGAYGGAVSLRNWSYDRVPSLIKESGRPTISVGGIHAGGSGKTPMALFLGTHLAEAGYEVAFVSRGYRRKSRQPLIVPPHKHRSWEETGDEPAMLHHNLPQSWLGVGADRVAVAHLLDSRLGENAVLVLDDAFQHRKIYRHLDIVCVPSIGKREALLPAGWLREPLISLRRAGLIAVIGSDQQPEELSTTAETVQQVAPGVPVVQMVRRSRGWYDAHTGNSIGIPDSTDAVAVAGIARPESFFHTVQKLGVAPDRCVRFSDHHPYTRDVLLHCLENKKGPLLTTEKDVARMMGPNLVKDVAICYLKIGLEFFYTEHDQLFKSVLDQALKTAFES